MCVLAGRGYHVRSSPALGDVTVDNLGFKRLTAENWLEPDEASSSFARFSAADGQFHPVAGEDWVREIVKPDLLDQVPREIRALFEVARGALAYGYFFYPLYTLGAEQLFRVVEAAVTFKCKAMGAPRSVSTFQEKLEYLRLGGMIPDQEKEAWHAIRKLRNIASHPEDQAIFMPGDAISMLDRIAGRINALFKIS